MTLSVFGNLTASALATRNTVGPQVSRRLQAHWDKELLLVWVWRSLLGGLQVTSIAQTLNCSITTFMRYAETDA